MDWEVIIKNKIKKKGKEKTEKLKSVIIKYVNIYINIKKKKIFIQQVDF